MTQRALFGDQNAKGVRSAAALTVAAWFLILGSGCAGGSGSGGGSTPEPEPVPLWRYVGTWQGTWTAVGTSFGHNPPHGPMTVTVEADGNFSGQLTDVPTGKTGSVTGTLTANGAYGSAQITASFGEHSQRDFSQVLITPRDGHLTGSMSVPVQAASTRGTPATNWTLATFDLTRQ